jgi:TusA-related sulfurtransferase
MGTTNGIEATAAPSEWPHERLDASELPPPEPLTETLERLTEMDDECVLVQVNDRAPQHLYPKLDDRGWCYDTVETAEGVLTAIWRDR